MFRVVAPIAFVLLWSTGWVVAEIALPHAGPLTFLSIRYFGALAILLPLALMLRARFPQGARGWGHALANGAMLHGVYLGGVWIAIAHGVPSGISALIATLQPILTVLAAGPLLGERLRPRQAVGVAAGVLGVAAIVAPKLGGVGSGEALWPIAVNVLGMVAVTVATLHQKGRLRGQDLRGLAVAQYVGALAITGPAAWIFEGFRFEWTPATVGALAWGVLALSIVAIFLMLAMIERGALSRVSALIFLVPPLAALQSYLLFGETLSALQIAGAALAAGGVLLINAAVPRASAEGCIAAKALDDEDGSHMTIRTAHDA